MSYPPILYAGESGEVSAWLRPADTPPDVVYPNGNRVRYLARGSETEGLFGSPLGSRRSAQWTRRCTSTGGWPSRSTCCPGSSRSTTAGPGSRCLRVGSCTFRPVGCATSTTRTEPPRCCSTSRPELPGGLLKRVWPGSGSGERLDEFRVWGVHGRARQLLDGLTALSIGGILAPWRPTRRTSTSSPPRSTSPSRPGGAMARRSPPGLDSHDGDDLVLVSEDPTGKTKRLSRGGPVALQPCSMQGSVRTSPVVTGTGGDVRDLAEVSAIQRAVRAKYTGLGSPASSRACCRSSSPRNAGPASASRSDGSPAATRPLRMRRCVLAGGLQAWSGQPSAGRGRAGGVVFVVAPSPAVSGCSLANPATPLQPRGQRHGVQARHSALEAGPHVADRLR